MSVKPIIRRLPYCDLYFETRQVTRKWAMPKKIPDSILVAAVRYKVYTIVDWSRCPELNESVDSLDRELAALIKRIISADAPELQSTAREKLTDDILMEIRELGYNDLINLRSRLKPKIPISSRVSTWIRGVLLRSAERKGRPASHTKPQSVG